MLNKFNLIFDKRHEKQLNKIQSTQENDNRISNEKFFETSFGEANTLDDRFCPYCMLLVDARTKDSCRLKRMNERPKVVLVER